MVVSQVAIPKNWIKCILLSQNTEPSVGMRAWMRAAGVPLLQLHTGKALRRLNCPLLTRCFTPKTREVR